MQAEIISCGHKAQLSLQVDLHSQPLERCRSMLQEAQERGREGAESADSSDSAGARHVETQHELELGAQHERELEERRLFLLHQAGLPVTTPLPAPEVISGAAEQQPEEPRKSTEGQLGDVLNSWLVSMTSSIFGRGDEAAGAPWLALRMNFEVFLIDL